MQKQKHMHAHPHDEFPWRPTAEVGILAVLAVLTMVEARLPEVPGAIFWDERQQSAVKR